MNAWAVRETVVEVGFLLSFFYRSRFGSDTYELFFLAGGEALQLEVHFDY